MVAWLRRRRKGRRDDYPLEMLWRCLVAKYVYQIARFSDLVREHHPELAARIEAVIADAGYDSADNCRYVLDELHALPIIKMRLLEGKDKDAVSQAAKELCAQLGTQSCMGGSRMVYDGRDGDYLKGRCPVACAKADRCQ